MARTWTVSTRKDTIPRLLDWLRWRVAEETSPPAPPFPETWKKDVFGPMLNQILELGEDPDPDAIDAILKSPRHTRHFCQECHEYRDTVIQLGKEDESRGDDQTITVCQQCIGEAHSHLCSLKDST